MIYCPHCKKPSAQKDGLCPHCKQDLSGKSAPSNHPNPQQHARSLPSISGPVSSSYVPAAQDTTSTSPFENQPTYYIDDEMDTDWNASDADAVPGLSDNSDHGENMHAGSGLVLDSIAPRVPAPEPATTPKLDALSVSDVAQFGKPETGTIGALKYWLRVRSRLKELRVELQQSEDTLTRDVNNRRRRLAELGKLGHDHGIKSDEIEGRFTLALVAQGDLKGHQRKRLSQSIEHKSKIDTLTVSIKHIEQKLEPLKQEENTLKDKKQILENERRDIETPLKRVQIDHRNMENLIKQRRAACENEKTPKEQKGKLLTEITQFESRLPELSTQIEAKEAELNRVLIPIREIEQQLKSVRDTMAPELEKIMAINKEIDAQNRQFTAQDEAAQEKLDAESGKVERLWSEAGKQILSEEIGIPELADAKQQARDSQIAAVESERKHELLSRAIDSYDHETVKKAQITAAAALGGLILLLIIIGNIL